MGRLNTFKFSDFNEAYFEINRLCMLKPYKMIAHLESTQSGLYPLWIECESTKCDELNVAEFGLTAAKFTHLLRTYLPPDKVKELKGFGAKKAHNLAFDFRRKVKDEGTGNGSCMLELIISRLRRSQPWDTATIVWRTSEIGSRWASDLMLIHRCLEAIPNSDFKTIYLSLPCSYQSAIYNSALVDHGSYWRLDINELRRSDHPSVKLMVRNLDMYYRDHYDGLNERRLLSPGISMRKAYAKRRAGEKIPMIGINVFPPL
jgi:hypothetical protein